jgi:hypothetical protein
MAEWSVSSRVQRRAGLTTVTTEALLPTFSIPLHAHAKRDDCMVNGLNPPHVLAPETLVHLAQGGKHVDFYLESLWICSLHLISVTRASDAA